MSDYGAGAATQSTGSQQAANIEPLSTAEFLLDARAVIAAIETVIDGKRSVIETAVTVLLAEGHLSMEDVPGVGKTMLARALARSVDCTVSRIQFTPDLLPADITGVSIYNQSGREFEFKPGPVFANILIGDEINRASPKTQSALLESMEERQVTVDGASYALPDPFTVIATQNPIEMEGTYALPEAQRDRFTARISMGYPDQASEAAMLRTRETGSPLDALAPGRDTRTTAAHDRHRQVGVRQPRRRAVRRRDRRRHPRRPRAATRREPPRDAATRAGVEGAGQLSTDATSCFPTTSTRSPSRCSRTASSRVARERAAPSAGRLSPTSPRASWRARPCRSVPPARSRYPWLGRASRMRWTEGTRGLKTTKRIRPTWRAIVSLLLGGMALVLAYSLGRREYLVICCLAILLPVAGLHLRAAATPQVRGDPAVLAARWSRSAVSPR